MNRYKNSHHVSSRAKSSMPDANGAIVLLQMGLDGDGRHHGHDVQKENDVSDKWIGGFVPQNRLRSTST